MDAIVIGHYWWGWLDYVIGPARTVRNAIRKTMIDFLMSPIELLAFYAWITFTVYPHKSIIDKLRNDFVEPLAVGYLFWTPVTVLNFWVIPYHLRVLFMSIMCLIWETFLSYAANNDIVAEMKAFVERQRKSKLLG
jgi:protein Mpv17